MPNLASRIASVRAYAKLSQEEFAARLGVHPQTVYKWETGKRNPSQIVRDKLVELFGINPVWMHTGLGEMFAGDRPAASDPGARTEHLLRLTDDELHRTGYFRIPKLSVQVSAGDGAVVSIEEIEGEELMPGWLIRTRYGIEPGRLKRLTVRGDSMEPTIHAGEELFVALSNGEQVLHGAVYVLEGPHGVLVKRLYFEDIPSDDDSDVRHHVWIWSDNPDAQRYRIPLEVFQRDYRVLAYALEINRKL